MRAEARIRDMTQIAGPRAPALLLLLTLAFAFAPAVTPPFMGYLPGQLPVDVGRPAIQPAGYAFSIWALIYLWLIAHAVFGLIRRRESAAFAAPRPALMLSVALGTLWLAVASGWPLLAMLVIAVMAVAAIAAFLRTDPAQDHWMLSAPLSIYAGWLTAATLVSAGVLLPGYGWLGNETAAYAMIATATLAGLAIQARQPLVPTYAATLVWALIGVVQVNRGDLPQVAMAALAGAGLVALGSAVLTWRARA